MKLSKITFAKHKDGTVKNLCLSCFDCNRLKSDLEVIEFKELVKNKYPDKLLRNYFYFEFINI